MVINEAINNLKNAITKVWNDTKDKLRPNISRGHSRAISIDVEDLIGLFVSDIFDDELNILIDSSVHIDITHRPDMLVVKDGKVVAMIEVKTQMGCCRNATKVIDNEIIRMHEVFCKVKNLTCKFSKDTTQNVTYDENVKLFLIALTFKNGANPEQHKKNVEYAKSKGVGHYILFDGWYHSLVEKNIVEFAEELIKLK
ncbi:MAG: hypothetical protein ACI35S_03775 [Anaeroplasma sp.]